MSTTEYEILEQSDNLLPDEIIIDEILIRLPARSLCRFKSVSKLWNRVISSTRFAKSHLIHSSSTSNNNSKLVFYQAGKYSYLLDYEATDNHDVDENLSNFNMGPISSVDYLFGSSSCGLVCFLVGKNKICLCNPILRQCRMIYVPHSFVYKYSLVVCGFGYVSSIDDFKIVIGGTHYYEEGNNGTMYVFSLRNNSWRILQGSDGVNRLARPAKDWMGKLVNERLHWLIEQRKNDDYRYDDRIFAFDLADEVVDEIMIPAEALSSTGDNARFGDERSYGLSTMGGCLCLSIYGLEQGYIHIWTMKQYGVKDSWMRLHHFYVNQYHSANRCFKHDICFDFTTSGFDFTTSGKFLIQAIFKKDDIRIYLVDPYQFSPKLIPIWSFSSTIWRRAVNYVESLISPFGFGALTSQEKKGEYGETNVLGRELES